MDIILIILVMLTLFCVIMCGRQLDDIERKIINIDKEMNKI